MGNPIDMKDRGDLLRVVAPAPQVPAGLAGRAATLALASGRGPGVSWLERVIPLGLVTAGAAASASLWLWTASPATTALNSWDALPQQTLALAYDPETAWGMGGPRP